MDEQLIKLAKEKDFIGYMAKEWEHNTKESLRYCFWMCELQKWLIDNHNLYIKIETTFENTGLYSSKWKSVIDVPFKRFQWTTGHYYIGDTYEEALEQGLQEALKLI